MTFEPGEKEEGLGRDGTTASPDAPAMAAILKHTKFDRAWRARIAANMRMLCSTAALGSSSADSPLFRQLCWILDVTTLRVRRKEVLTTIAFRHEDHAPIRFQIMLQIVEGTIVPPTLGPIGDWLMFARPILLALALSGSIVTATAVQAAPAPAAKLVKADGVARVRSNHGFDETVTRLKAAIAAKGVRFFDAIDQQALGAEANLPIGKSVIVRFGNPPLGVQFLQANRYAGLDWPVRMLVVEEADGSVWLAWTDFKFMAKRYRITTQDAQFKMAATVAGAIAADAAN